MNILSLLRVLFVSLFLLITVVSCGGGDDTNPTDGDTSNLGPDTGNNIETGENIPDKDNGNLQYIKTSSITVKELWIRNEEGEEQQILSEKTTINLVPTENNFAEMNTTLSVSVGTYNQVRLVLDSGIVILSDNVYISQKNNPINHIKDKLGDKFKNLPVLTSPRLYTTQLDNLKFPSGYQKGIKVNIEPPIEVVSGLDEKLLVVKFDLRNSFVFNGSVKKEPGVKRVLFKPILKASNSSTHGIISFKNVNGINGLKCTSNNLPLNAATITAIDTSGYNPKITILTDLKGNASLTLLEGNYNFEIKKEGYDTKTISNIDIVAANKADDLNDKTLVKTRETGIKFDRDIAELLAIMSNIAYEDGQLIKDTFLPQPSYSTKYLGSSDDDACWVTHDYITFNFSLYDQEVINSQLFIASNSNSGDIVVSFEGSSDLADYLITDTQLNKDAWAQPNADFSSYETYPKAVHKGIHDGYRVVRQQLIASLKTAISKSKNHINPRIYFTGHSLGGALATFASLELADHLVETYQYPKHNIIMYSFGAPRSIAGKLKSVFNSHVPNGFAVVAKDDIVAHLLGTGIGRSLDEYTHIYKLAVLSSNITGYGDRNTYTGIGETRVEHSKGRRFKGCQNLFHPSKSVAPINSIGGIILPVTNVYGKKGHDRLKYIDRIREISSGTGIPKLNIATIDRGVLGVNFIFDWRGGAQGPCDRVSLYVTNKKAKPVSGEVHRNLGIEQSEMVVNGEKYPVNGYFETLTTPYYWVLEWRKSKYGIPYLASVRKVKNNDYWVGYEDGFGEIIASKCWNCN